MKCKCGSIVIISEDNCVSSEYNMIVICNNCNIAYLESDFSEREIEKTYWNDMPTEDDVK